ncbi:MAG: PDZ domain-containing protein [Gemmataceae bacterium]
MNRIRLRWGVGLRLAVAIGLFVVAVVPGLSDTASAERQDKLEALRKQLAEIQKQISDLEKPVPQAPTLPDGTLKPEWIQSLSWRSIGPAAMGGRITDISVYEADPSTFWVATASGGLVKTINNGITFEHQFDKEGTVSIGAVAVAPSDRSIVYVGTGEANPRNSVSYGDGVYRSIDGGAHWKNVGLKKSFQIGKIVVHPKDPNTAYVGALGRLYGPNEERGLFKTTNGGESWEKVLYLDENTGIIDMVMNPSDPNTLIVAAWERKRDEFDNFVGEPPPDGVGEYDPIVKYGKKGGLYKTTDGGKTFKKLEKGLPTAMMGRIGLDFYRKDPKIVFAIIDTEKWGTGVPPSNAYVGISGDGTDDGYKLTELPADGPAAKAGLKAGDILMAFDGKPVKGTGDITEIMRSKKVGDKIKVKFKRGEEGEKEVEITVATRPTQGGGGRGGNAPPSPGFRGEPDQGGLKITQITEDGPAAAAGLKLDDIVLTLDGKPVTTFIEMMTSLREKAVGDKIKLTYQRGAEKKEVTVALAQLRFGGAGGGGGQRGPQAAPKGTPRPYAGRLGGNNENAQDQQGPDGFQSGGVFKSTDGGETWTRINSVNPRPMYFSVIRVDPTDDKYIYVLGIRPYRSTNGGKTFTSGADRGVHDDQHALWIDPRDGRHMIVGCDGGFYQTYDRGERWDHLNHLALGQFYHVAVDSRRLYNVYGGLQDNGSWGGPSMTLRGSGPVNEDWIFVSGGDGFVCRVDPNDPDLVYYESQDGNIGRRNLRTGERASIRPRREGQGGPGGRGPQGKGGGQGKGGQGRAAAQGKAPEGKGGPPSQSQAQQVQHRFNWNTPFILSNHNPSIFYSAGEVVFRSLKKGDELKVISPEITRTKKGSATALAESPRNPEVLWVGTDDGAIHVSRDGGVQWTRVDEKVGLPGPRCVASLEPSREVEGRCYVAFDAHRSNDDDPYVYVTEDYGQTWKSLRGNLPMGSSRVLREDFKNPNVLYLGTEFAAWASVNRGASWAKINNNLPTVAVHDLLSIR